MTAGLWIRSTASLLVVALISSCSLQRVNESAGRAENDAATASQYSRFLRNQQQEPARETVVFSDKPWVSKQPMVAKRGLPLTMDCDITYRPSYNVGIAEVAHYITSECGVPVIVAPDAIDPSVLSSPNQGNSGTTAPPVMTSPDNLSSFMPAGVIGNMPSNVRSMSMGGLSAPSTFPIKYSGKLSGLLNQVTAQQGLAWNYSSEDRSVRITYFDTKTFDVWAFGDDQVIESTVKSGLLTATGSGSGSGGGGGGSSSTGASGESGSNQSTTVTIKTSLIGDIEKNVKAMLSQQPAGRMFLSRSTGTLTVNDRPEVLSNVATYLNSINRSITRQVLFNVKVFEVSLTDKDQTGLDWTAVYTSLNNKWGFSLKNATTGISTGAVSGSLSILDTSKSPWAGSGLIIKALSEQGRISNVRSPSVTTLNLQPAPIQIGNVQSYIASSSTTTTASVGSSTSLSPATITSGFNMMLLPRIIDQDNMLLMITLSMSSKPTFTTFTSNGSSVQTADYDTKNLSPKVKLRSGQTLVLTGFEENTENATKSGVGDPSFFGLGGSRLRETGHNVLVVLITPVVDSDTGSPSTLNAPVANDPCGVCPSPLRLCAGVKG
ncbi:PilN family type IVB pilus formation outer membrane protein [Pseudomonas gessardii]|uniref:PilN family type IVB pilus formation outer membrane protein n=2 Tax=Pseudomonas gessardii TaxID=78544 RepID=A0ABS9FCB3_9PSED|nr:MULTISPECIES: PilN family type IVB pilus formation outer membrane protein [Pseudomonadaceae]MCF5097648.1 PilN family type IVB pilus formation outer membrane protein [Pseudomonas gessardii]MCF5109995.1 PilN family type IVB pilus formation outer membrane protein [Pseudomonas gessardii]MCF5508360.1 PilN family type IVB pilus formation outer membrane protein [Pseudomonas sp. PA-3-6H]MCF5517827.1 PilN family type IVB pilus formation outer membrane protein [Pseudomonas sp. PA-3-6E]MCF5562165.1 Pi